MYEAPQKPTVPTAWFLVALAQQWVLWMLLPGPTIAVSAVVNVAGLVMLLGGAAFLGYASRHGATRRAAPHTWVGCPLYLAMLTCLAGSALWFGTLTGILPIAGFVSVVSSQFVSLDEQALIRRSAGPMAQR